MTRIVTWNVNSLRAREEMVVDWCTELEPDIVCLQETKLADDAFPALTFRGLGYEAVHHGQGRWNGVAIASRPPVTDVVTGFADDEATDPEARVLTARCGDLVTICCYAPNGRALDDDQYVYKLAWFDRLLAHLDAVATPADRLVLTGDLNIAPTDLDVWDATRVHGATHVSPPERTRFDALCDWGLVDLFRAQHGSADRLYSWWDYRSGNFHKHRGMRIDHVLGTAPVAASLRLAVVDRNARKGKGTSDHAPLLVDV